MAFQSLHPYKNAYVAIAFTLGMLYLNSLFPVLEKPTQTMHPTGALFPAIEGKTLSGEWVCLPLLHHQQPSVVLIGFGLNGKKCGQEWARAALDEKLIPPNFAFYAIAAIKETFYIRPLKSVIEQALRTVVPKKAHTYFIVYFEKGNVLRSFLRSSTEDSSNQVCLLVLDRDGFVQWNYTGAVSKQAKVELKAVCQKFKSPNL